MLVALATFSTLLAQQTGVHPLSGRRYAAVMGYQGADWLDREERDIEEAPGIVHHHLAERVDRMRRKLLGRERGRVAAFATAVE